MNRASREVLHVFDYKNVKTASVHSAGDDSRIIEQRRDKDILIYRQGGENVAPATAWTRLATLVESQLGGYELVDEAEGFLQDDFDIYEYLGKMEAAPVQERVSSTETPTEHRKLN
jgi:hypothetical protein